MASKDYWQDRFVQLEEAQLDKGIEYYHELEKQYRKASNEIQKQITTWYARFAVNNEISMTEARKILTNNELKELRWDVEEYIKAGRENAIDGRWMKELENASARVHISRLEAIKLQMQQQIEVLYGNELDSFDEVMREVYTESYYRTAYEIQKGIGVGSDLMRLDKGKVDKVLSKPWAADGSNFSSRIWKQRSQMVSELHNQLTQTIMRGQTPDAAIKAIKERFRVSQGQASRLVMTELAFFHSAGQKDSFNELGVERYEICAVLDHRTSEVCRNMDGKVADMKDFQPGVTAPPFHAWCRTTTVPYFDDEFTEDEVRAARGEDGKTYYVPADMNYHEWKETFVDGGSKKGLNPTTEPLENIGESGTIGARTNTGKTVYFNESNDYSINIEGLSEKVNTDLSNAAKAVARMGSADGYEHMCLVDLGGKLDIYEETNEMFDAVGLRFWKYAEEHPESTFAFVHNHNTDSSLSQTDLETPILCNNIPIQIAVRNDGVKYIAKRKKLAPDGYYPDVYFESKLKTINDKSKNGELTAIERLKERERIIIEALTEEFYEGIEISDGRK